MALATVVPGRFCCSPAFPADSNPNQTHLLHLSSPTTGYFRALGMELRKGRWLKLVAGAEGGEHRARGRAERRVALPAGRGAVVDCRKRNNRAFY
jgi:hypothetical protein